MCLALCVRVCKCMNSRHNTPQHVQYYSLCVKLHIAHIYVKLHKMLDDTECVESKLCRITKTCFLDFFHLPGKNYIALFVVLVTDIRHGPHLSFGCQGPPCLSY